MRPQRAWLTDQAIAEPLRAGTARCPELDYGLSPPDARSSARKPCDLCQLGEQHVRITTVLPTSRRATGSPNRLVLDRQDAETNKLARRQLRVPVNA
jgi:hypothetical protein